MKNSSLYSILISVILVCLRNVQATLTSNTSVACPDDTVTFTCTLPGDQVRWQVTPPPGSSLSQATGVIGNNISTFAIGVPGFMFQVVLTDVNGGITSTLTTVTEVSLLEGTMVTCNVFSGVTEGPLVITVADPPSPPLSPRVSFTPHQANTSTVTVEWSPSSSGGVPVSYVLTIFPPPLSESPLTVESTSAQITVSYNTQYNLTIRADNCAGSNETTIVVELIACSSPTAGNGVSLNSVPAVTTEGSTLTFTCTEVNQMIVSTCGSDGRWSPDPQTHVCPTLVPPVTCDPPGPPSMGRVITSSQSYIEGSEVTYHCDNGLFPTGVMTSTCTDVGGRGEWVPVDPSTVVCRTTPVNCSLPPSPVNGSIVNYERLNGTVVEGTVLTYQCESGLSLTGPTNITCTNAGQWSTDPLTLTCVISTIEPPPGGDVGAIAGGLVGGVLAMLFVIIVIVLVVWCVRRDKPEYKSSEQNMEMAEGFQGEYSELRHGGPKKGSKKSKPSPADSDGYNRITHQLDQGPPAYDDVKFNPDQRANGSSDGYSTVNNGQDAQRLPGYGQLNNVPTVEPVMYAALGVGLKTPTEAPEVDQHVVTYATVDIAATNRQKAATMPVSTKNPSVEQADKLLNLDQALVQLRPVQSRWQELAQALQVPDTYIQQIDESCGKDHANSMTEVVDYWMRNCSGQPTWRELADTLKRIKENQLAKQLMSIYETGRLPVELDMNEVPKEVYKYDNAPPPPLPARSPTITDDTDSPGLSKTLPPSRPPKYNGDKGPSRPPKPPRKNESPVPPRPPKPPPKH